MSKIKKSFEEILFMQCYGGEDTFTVKECKSAIKIWLEQKNHKLTYLTQEEMKMEKEMVNLQVVLGLQSCKTRADVCELLEDLRQHERFLLIKGLGEKV